MSKRKRDDLDDDELVTPGKQILPVANLPDNFSGVPADGLEYLFTVRRDARKLPLITRAHIPYESSVTTVLPSTHIMALTHPSLPSEEWRGVYVTHFKNFRQNLKRPETFIQVPGTKLMPDKQERDLWWAFLAGRPESEWNPPKQPKQRNVKGLHALQASIQPEPAHDEGEVELALRVDPTEAFPTPSCTPVGSDGIEESTAFDESFTLAFKPRAPTPLLLKHIDQRYSLHLLMYFAHWINQHLQDALPRLSETHAQWMFVLLALVDEHVSADSMNMLRNLVRANIALLKVLLQEEASQQLPPSEKLLSPKSCWLIITTVIDIWGQLDLWVDAQDMLRSIQSVT